MTADTGVLNYCAIGVAAALTSVNRGNLFAYGMSPEGIENNEVIYELCSDMDRSGPAPAAARPGMSWPDRRSSKANGRI